MSPQVSSSLLPSGYPCKLTLLHLAEFDVAITDFALFGECMIFVAILLRAGKASSARWFSALFLSTGCAALLGSIYHGFLSPTTGLARGVWALVMVLLGVTALSEGAIAANLALAPRKSAKVKGLLAVLFTVYCVSVVFFYAEFRLAIAGYLFGLGLLLLALVLRYRATADASLLAGAIGIVLTVVASWLQQVGFSVSDRYLTHNAVYHVIQAAALGLLFITARSLVSKECA